MKFFAISTALCLLPGLHALTINTPSGVTECEPQLLEWSNGTAPYYIAILPGSTTDEDPLKSFDTTSATSLTWTVDIISGTSITLRAKDSTGTIAYSDAVTIQSGSDSSCVSSSTGVSASYGTTDSSSTATAYVQ
ncbi:hypothetical protein BDZ89DRAFT_942172 [Hymenopellis radicata]|nr:hypothetical protein BDZ89DRAFT_942172 [Hymenopellis radicata]